MHPPGKPGLAATRLKAQASLIALGVGLGLSGLPAFAQTMPNGGSVVAGSATITQSGNGQLTIRQTTDRGVINWRDFSVGAGGRVEFQQPSTSSATLNRVTGSTSSTIAGQISANGQVFLINPNGIQITPTGTIRSGAFVASTMDIRNDDFLSGRLAFQGNGSSAAVTNQGTIEVAPGGSVVLMGGRVANDGTIIANGGRVGLVSGERVTVDLQGDGFLQVSVPTADSDRATALIRHTGRIQANGGRVEMRAATTADVARAAINVSGTIEARTVRRTEGGVLFGAEPGAPAPAAPTTVQRGTVVIDGGPAGSVKSTGTIKASGGSERGGDITIAGGVVALAGSLDVSGGTTGGTISVDGGSRLDVTGSLTANGGVAGGRIDLTGDTVYLTSATLTAAGGDVGGLIRVGGGFQGGKLKENAPEIEATFVTRWGDLPALRSAQTMVADAGTRIDVSGGQTGGTVVVWSDNATTMLGSITATGALSGGSVELSASSDLLNVDLARLALGAGGQVLLDPRDITVTTAGSAALASNDQFADNPASSVQINPTAITALLNVGTSVTLQANRDITVSSAIAANNTSGNGGNLTMQAGRSITISAAITTDNGNLSLTANETTAAGVVNAQRGTGTAVLTFSGQTITAGTGAVSILMNTGAGLTTPTSGNITLGTIASAGSVNVTYSGPTAAGLTVINGNITASGDVSFSDRNLRVTSNSVITSTAGTVSWAGEATGKTIAATAGTPTISFVQGTATTRFGRMDTADAARLTIGQVTASRQYGDANPTVNTPLRLISGTLNGGDTVANILTAASTTTTWGAGSPPAATANVGSYGYTVSATGSLAITAGQGNGVFINTTPQAGTLSVTAAPLTVTANAQTKVYGNADPTLTFAATGFKNGETSAVLTGALSRAAGETVAGGPYAINQGTLAGTNYTITYTGANLTITAAPLNVVAAAKTKVYGDADPALTYTATGFKFSDTAATVLTGGLTRTAGQA
ncbi:MAG TPA: MBG domain-containing protein, partial [Vineibacter sp.]|nr:MBG domain-containing protein [Vineibacter sp.]